MNMRDVFKAPVGLRLLVPLLAITACAKTPPLRTAAQDDETALQLERVTAAVGDEPVASVNGRPIMASCVRDQAQATRRTAAAALQNCIDFELMAQAAEQRQLHRHPDITAAHRAARANSFIARNFEQVIRTPMDLPVDFRTKVLAKYAWRKHRVDYRASAFVRVTVPASVAAGSPEDEAARATAQRIYEAAKKAPGLFATDLDRIAKAVSPELGVSLVELRDDLRLVPPYAKALFAIAEVGEVAPPTRTEWGWDVILLTDRLPPRDFSDLQVLDEMFNDLRIGYFQTWLGQTVKQQAYQVKRHPKLDQLLGAGNQATPDAPLPQ